MPDRADEERLARFVEKLWRCELGRESGSARLYEPGQYGVDFLYPHATPPAALEITSLRNESWKSGTKAAERHVPRLDQTAKRERQGDWRLRLDALVNVKEITAAALDLMRAGQDGGGSGWRFERVADTPHRVLATTMQWRKVGGDPSLRLALTALANIRKLAASKPDYETHLAIEADYGELPRIAAETHVPPRDGGFEELAALDWVWVIPRHGHADEPTAWFARPGDLEWRTSDVKYDSRPL